MSTTELRDAASSDVLAGLEGGRAAPRRRRLRRVAAAGACVLALAGLVALLTIASRAAFGGNSDGATLVLEGQTVVSGHLALSGWALSYDSFWTLEVPFYALAVAIFGVHEWLMWAVPAVFAALLLAAAVWVARDRRRDRASLVACAVVAAMLAFPGPSLAFFLLQSGWHAATALWCLLAFALVARSGSRRTLALATVLLATALLGDLLSLTVGVLPVLAAGLLAARRERRLAAARRHLAAAGGSVLLAVLLRGLALAGGTYSIGSRSVLALPGQVVENIGILADRIAALFGVVDLVGGLSSPPLVLRAAPLLLLCLAVWAVGSALSGSFRATRRATAGRRSAGQRLRRRRAPAAAADADNAPAAAAAAAAAGMPSAAAVTEATAGVPPWVLDDLLVIGIVGDVCSFVIFGTDGSPDLARYLLPGYVYAAMLAARWLARQVRARPAAGRPVLAMSGLVLALSCAGFAAGSLGPPAPQEARQLAGFLAAHHLTDGLGDYWSSSLVTVDSGGEVAVRPVTVGRDGLLVRYDKQSDAGWYAGKRFQFLVYDSANIWQGVDAGAAVATFGRPRTIYDVGSYRVLRWSRALTVSAALLPQS